MISPGSSLIGRVVLRDALPTFVLALTAVLAAGCVDLTKPPVIQECAAAGNCSDDPADHVKRDAKDDAEEPTADTGDAGPADAAPDAPRDVNGDAEPIRDTRDATGTDSRDGGDAAPDSLSGDVGPDTPPDLPRPDTADAGVDVRPDAPPDLPPDLGRDQGVDFPPDSPPDTTPDASPLMVGLLAYYKCDNATGTSLPDSSGNDNHGTLFGGSAGYSFQTGKVGKALSLAKAGSGYASLPSDMFANATELTVAAWVNVTTAQNWQRVLDVGFDAKAASNSSTGTRYMNLVPKNDGSNLLFSISKDGYSNEQKLSATAPSTGTWKHVAVVLSASSSALYLDGTAVSGAGTVSLRPKDLGTIDYAFLGKSQFTSDPYFDGLLDEVRVYGRALSAAEVKALTQFTGP